MKQGNQIKNMLNKKMEHLALPLFAIFLGFVIGGLVIALSGYDPFATIGRDPGRWIWFRLLSFCHTDPVQLLSFLQDLQQR